MNGDIHKERKLGGYRNPFNIPEVQKNIEGRAIAKIQKSVIFFGFLTNKILLGGPRTLKI